LIICGLQLLEIALHPRIDLGDPLLKFRLGEVPPLRVDGSELTAIDRHERTAEQITLFAHQCKGATDVAERCEVVTPKVGDRFVIGPQLLEQPHQFHVALRLLLQAPARP
jgi:hypothetical protein